MLENIDNKSKTLERFDGESLYNFFIKSITDYNNPEKQ